jgi:hypothetical protein
MGDMVVGVTLLITLATDTAVLGQFAPVRLTDLQLQHTHVDAM